MRIVSNRLRFAAGAWLLTAAGLLALAGFDGHGCLLSRAFGQDGLRTDTKVGSAAVAPAGGPDVLHNAAPAPATTQPGRPVRSLRANINLAVETCKDDPPRAWLGPDTFDLACNAGAAPPRAWVTTRRRIRASGAGCGTYFNLSFVRLSRAAWKYFPPEFATADDLPAGALLPFDPKLPDRRRVDLTQPAVRTAFVRQAAWYVCQRDADFVMGDGVYHPLSGANPVSPATGRAISWADVCSELAGVAAAVAPAELLTNVTLPPGLWPDDDVTAWLATGASGLVCETPFINTRFVPRNCDTGRKISAQVRRFLAAGRRVVFIPWIDLPPGLPADEVRKRRDAEAMFIAGWALLLRPNTDDPLVVTFYPDRLPEWEDWAARLGAPRGDFETVRVRMPDETIVEYFQRDFAGGRVQVSPAASSSRVLWRH